MQTARQVSVKFMRFAAPVALALALLPGVARPAAAQFNVTTADIQRLQDNSYDASRDIAQLRTHDSVLAAQLQAELDDVRDEVVYLKVKLRKNESIARSEYAVCRPSRQDREHPEPRTWRHGGRLHTSGRDRS